jgi:hypothetical protein
MVRGSWALGVLLAWVVGCGSSVPDPESPDDARLEEVDPDWDTGERRGAPSESDAETEQNLAQSETHERPQFTEGMSVEQAIAAVPRHYDFVGIDQETLAKPLQDPETYKECNIGSQHFTLRVAVWEGRAVGIDTDAKNETLKACLVEKTRAIQWKESVESINTVEYSF